MCITFTCTEESYVKCKNTDKIPDIPENTTPEDQPSIDDSLHCQDQKTDDTFITEKANDTTSMDQRVNDMPPIDHKPTDTPFMGQSIKDTTVVDQEDNGTPSIDKQVNDALTLDQKADDIITGDQKAKDAPTVDKKTDTKVAPSIDQENDMFEVEVSTEEIIEHLTLVRQYLIPRSDFTCITNSEDFGTTNVVKWCNSDCSLQEFNLDFTKPEDKRKFGKYLSTCATLSKLRHPNIQQLWGFVSQEEESTKPSASIITEILDLTLTELLTNHKYNEIQTATHISICYDVAKAVSYLHSSKVSHLLIRSDCILLTRDYRAKLGDIASSLLYQSGLNNEIKMINENYLPPDGKLPGASGTKIDTFSTGVLFLQIVTHVAPNPVPTDETYCTEIQRRQDHIDLVHSSHPLFTLIITCLSNKPEDRPTDEEMCSILETSMSTQD